MRFSISNAHKRVATTDRAIGGPLLQPALTAHRKRIATRHSGKYYMCHEWMGHVVVDERSDSYDDVREHTKLD